MMARKENREIAPIGLIIFSAGIDPGFDLIDDIIGQRRSSVGHPRNSFGRTAQRLDQKAAGTVAFDYHGTVIASSNHKIVITGERQPAAVARSIVTAAHGTIVIEHRLHIGGIAHSAVLITVGIGGTGTGAEKKQERHQSK